MSKKFFKSPFNNFLSASVLVNGNTLYLSGSLGVATSGQIVSGGIGAETEQSLKNLGFVLQEAGFSFKDVVKTTVLLADIEDTPAVNEVYSRYFQVNPPARACYEVGCLPKNALVEIEAIAIKENSLDEIVSKL